jgi:hypothetical protein
MFKMENFFICPECKGNAVALDAGGITGKFKCKNCGYIGLMPELCGGFRYFFTSSGLLVLAGKNANQNEELVKSAGNNELLLHTKSPGSPFCLIKGKASEKDLEEAANFCACFSKEWKNKKKGVIEVDVFLKRDVYKQRGMPLGTFGVKKVLKRIVVKPILFLNLTNEMLEALPYKKNEIVATIERGNKERDEIIKEINKFAREKNYGVGLLILPAHGLKIKWKIKKQTKKEREKEKR